MTIDRATPSQDGILIVGHGTRHAVGTAELHALARQVAALQPASMVGSCFLEMVSPTVAQGVDELLARGVRRLMVAPIMLFSAQHVQVDIPEQVAAAVANWPDVEVSFAGHLGCHEKLVELSGLRFAEAAPAGADEQAGTLLVMVGRGNHDLAACDEMKQFTRLCAAARSVSEFRICYMAMAEPSLDRALDDAGRQSFERIVVQPHLLFDGALLERLRRQVAKCGKQFPRIQWCLAERLGPHRLLAEVVVDRVRCAPGVSGSGSRE